MSNRHRDNEIRAWPIIVHTINNDATETHVLWPLIKRVKTQNKVSFKIRPFLFTYEKDTQTNTFTLMFLFYMFYLTISPTKFFLSLLPLLSFHYKSLTSQYTILFSGLLLFLKKSFPQGKIDNELVFNSNGILKNQKIFQMLFPFYWRFKSLNKDIRFILPLYFFYKDDEFNIHLFWPIFGKQTRENRYTEYSILYPLFRVRLGKDMFSLHAPWPILKLENKGEKFSLRILPFLWIRILKKGGSRGFFLFFYWKYVSKNNTSLGDPASKFTFGIWFLLHVKISLEKAGTKEHGNHLIWIFMLVLYRKTEDYRLFFFTPLFMLYATEKAFTKLRMFLLPIIYYRLDTGKQHFFTIPLLLTFFRNYVYDPLDKKGNEFCFFFLIWIKNKYQNFYRATTPLRTHEQNIFIIPLFFLRKEQKNHILNSNNYNPSNNVNLDNNNLNNNNDTNYNLKDNSIIGKILYYKLRIFFLPTLTYFFREKERTVNKKDNSNNAITIEDKYEYNLGTNDFYFTIALLFLISKIDNLKRFYLLPIFYLSITKNIGFTFNLFLILFSITREVEKRSFFLLFIYANFYKKNNYHLKIYPLFLFINYHGLTERYRSANYNYNNKNTMDQIVKIVHLYVFGLFGKVWYGRVWSNKEEEKNKELKQQQQPAPVIQHLHLPNNGLDNTTTTLIDDGVNQQTTTVADQQDTAIPSDNVNNDTNNNDIVKDDNKKEDEKEEIEFENSFLWIFICYFQVQTKYYSTFFGSLFLLPPYVYHSKEKPYNYSLGQYEKKYKIMRSVVFPFYMFDRDCDMMYIFPFIFLRKASDLRTYMFHCWFLFDVGYNVVTKEYYLKLFYIPFLNQYCLFKLNCKMSQPIGNSKIKRLRCFIFPLIYFERRTLMTGDALTNLSGNQQDGDQKQQYSSELPYLEIRFFWLLKDLSLCKFINDSRNHVKIFDISFLIYCKVDRNNQAIQSERDGQYLVISLFYFYYYNWAIFRYSRLITEYKHTAKCYLILLFYSEVSNSWSPNVNNDYNKKDVINYLYDGGNNDENNELLLNNNEKTYNLNNEHTFTLFWLFTKDFSLIYWSRQFTTKSFYSTYFYIAPFIWFDKYIYTTTGNTTRDNTTIITTTQSREKNISLFWFLHKKASLFYYGDNQEIVLPNATVQNNENTEINNNQNNQTARLKSRDVFWFIFPIYYFSLTNNYKVMKFLFLPSNDKYGFSLFNYYIEYQPIENDNLQYNDRKLETKRYHFIPFIYKEKFFTTVVNNNSREREEENILTENNTYLFWLFDKRLSFIRFWKKDTSMVTARVNNGTSEKLNGFYIFYLILYYTYFNHTSKTKVLCLGWLFDKYLSFYHYYIKYSELKPTRNIYSNERKDYNKITIRNYILFIYYYVMNHLIANSLQKEFYLFWIIYKRIAFIKFERILNIITDRKYINNFYIFPLFIWRRKYNASFDKRTKYSLLWFFHYYLSLFHRNIKYLHNRNIIVNNNIGDSIDEEMTTSQMENIYKQSFIQEEKDYLNEKGFTFILILIFNSFDILKNNNFIKTKFTREIYFFWFFYKRISLMFYLNDYQQNDYKKQQCYLFPIFIWKRYNKYLQNNNLLGNNATSNLIKFVPTNDTVQIVVDDNNDTNNNDSVQIVDSNRVSDSITTTTNNDKIQDGELTFALFWLFHPIASLFNYTKRFFFYYKIALIKYLFENITELNGTIKLQKSFYIFPIILYYFKEKKISFETRLSKCISIGWLFHKYITCYYYFKKNYLYFDTNNTNNINKQEETLKCYLQFLFYLWRETATRELKFSIFWFFARQLSFIRYSRSLKDSQKLQKFLIFPFFKFERHSQHYSRWCLIPFVPVKFSWIANMMVYEKFVSKHGLILENGIEDKSSREQNRYVRVLFRFIRWQVENRVETFEFNPFYSSLHDYNDGYKKWDLIGGCVGHVTNSVEHGDACRCCCCCFI
ncbi:hypothetical protein ABK040_009727 [Willaertia magna]